MQSLCILFLSSLLLSHGLVDYDDATIKASLRFEYDVYSPEDREGKALLTVRAAKHEGKGRPVVSVTSVLDISKSMDNIKDIAYGEKTRLDFLKLANRYVVDRLALTSESHQYGAVVFSTAVEELTPLKTMTEDNAKDARNRIEGINATGRTNLFGGLMTGIDQQSQKSEGDRIRVLLLFTDGLPTDGKYLSRRRIVRSLREALKQSKEDIIIHVFAVGERVNYGLLKDIADVGGGIFDHVVKDSDIPKAFASVLGGLLTESSLNLKYDIVPVGPMKITGVKLSSAKITYNDTAAEVFITDLVAEEERHIIISYTVDNTTDAKCGIRVNGTYKHAVTHEPIQLTLEDFIVFKEDAPATKVADDIDLWNFRYKVSDKLDDASNSIGQGDTRDGIRKINKIKDGITNSKYKDDPYMKLVMKDLDMLLKYFDLKKNTKKSDEGMMKGLSSVIGGGRPQSVDDMFETVRGGETSTPSDLKIEVEDYMQGQDLKSTFDIPIHSAVSLIKDGKPKIYKVQLSVVPPIVTSNVPLSLSIVIDKDSSNDETKETFADMVDMLEKVVKDLKTQPAVHLGIVASSGNVETVLNLTKSTEIDVDAVVDRIKQLNATGGTALGKAVAEAIRQQRSQPLSSGVQAVFVVTDGAPIDTDLVCQEMKKGLAGSQYQINVHTFCVKGCNKALLKNMADLGKGEHHDILQSKGLPPAVAGVLWGLLKVGATDIQVDMKPAEAGVKIVDSLPKAEAKKKRRTIVLEDLIQGDRRDLLMTVKAPKTAETLLDVTVKYTDVLKPSLFKSRSLSVPAIETGSTKNREIDDMLVKNLKESKEGGLTHSRLPAVIDTVYDQINKVGTTKGGDKDYKDDLKSDLEKIAESLEKARDGDEEDLRKADWLMDTFTDTLEDQCIKGAGHRVLKVQDIYGDEDVDKKVEEYRAPEEPVEEPEPEPEPEEAPRPYVKPEAKNTTAPDVGARKTEIAPTLPKPKPKPPPPPPKLADPFSVAYLNVSDELTSAAQTVTIQMELEALNASDFTPGPAGVVFAVDASASTTPEEIAKAKDAAILKWKSMKDVPSMADSCLTVMPFGEKVTTVLDKVPMANLTESDIATAFDGITPSGEGNFKDAYEAAYDVLADIRKGQPKTDLQVVAYVGDSIKDANGTVDGPAFRAKHRTLGFPATFVTATTKDDVNMSYFKPFPVWMQRDIVDADAVAPKITDPPLVKRLSIEPNPARGVAVLDVEDGLSSDYGYVLPDLKASDRQSVDVKLLLPKSTSPQILHMPRLGMFDMRTLKKNTVRGKPLMIKRVDVEEVEDLIDLQKKVNESVHEIAEHVEKDEWPDALTKTSEAITDIKESGMDDDEMMMVGDMLEDAGKEMYIASAGDEDSKDKVVDMLDEISKSFGIRDPPPEPEPVEDLPEFMTMPGMFGDESGMKDEGNFESEPPELIFDDSQKTTADKEATLGLTIKAPKDHGGALTARTIILIDASATAAVQYQQQLVDEILSSLANRDGQRQVDIFKCNEKVEEIYSVESFLSMNADEAKETVKAVTPGGKLDILAVLDFLKALSLKSSVITIVYWTTASKTTDYDQTTLAPYVKHFKHETKVTIMTYKADKSGPFPQVLTDISEATGGWSFVLFRPAIETNEELVKSRIQYAAWSSVGWIEKTHAKEIVVNFVAKPGASIARITSTEDSAQLKANSLIVPSMPYDGNFRVEITVGLDELAKKVGIWDALDATMMYVLVRNPEVREMISKTATIEILKPDASAKVATLNALIKTTGTEIFELLGRNLIEKALKKTKDIGIQPKLSGLDLGVVQETVDLYGSIGKTIEEYLDDRDEYSAIQKVPTLYLESKTEAHHYSDEGAYLNVKAFPPSTLNNESTFRSTIVIETPGKAEEVIAFSADLELVSLVVIFDVAEYDFLIDDEVPVMEVQKMTVARLMDRLIKEGHAIDLSVVGASYDHVKRLDAKRFNEDNVDDIMDHLNKIKEYGSPSNLLFGLKMGLPMIQEAKDSRRIALLFTHASNVDLVEAASYEDVLAPYITYPINPVKVLTFMLGEAREWKPDTISALTGGRKIHFEHVMEMRSAVDKSMDALDASAARHVRIDIQPTKWCKNGVEVSKKGRTLLMGIVGDMLNNARRTIDLDIELDEWEGDKDLFEYSISYFLSNGKRWYQTPTQTFKLRRVDEKVLKTHEDLQSQLAPLLKAAIKNLKKGNLAVAADFVHGASSIAHKANFQDDSLVRAYSGFLTKNYGEIMRLIMTGSEDTSATVKTILSEGLALGLDLEEDTGKSEEEEEEYGPKEEKEEEGGGDDDWWGFSPWFGFIY